MRKVSSAPTSASFSVLSVESAATAGSLSARDLQRRDFFLLPSVFLFAPNLHSRLRTELPCDSFVFVVYQTYSPYAIPSGLLRKNPPTSSPPFPFVQKKSPQKSRRVPLFDSRQVGESYVQVGVACRGHRGRGSPCTLKRYKQVYSG